MTNSEEKEKLREEFEKWHTEWAYNKEHLPLNVDLCDYFISQIDKILEAKALEISGLKGITEKIYYEWYPEQHEAYNEAIDASLQVLTAPKI